MLRALGLAPHPCPAPTPLPPSLHTPCRSWMLLCYQAGAAEPERGHSLGQSLVLFSLSLCVEASQWEVSKARQSQGRRRGQVQRGCPRLWSP